MSFLKLIRFPNLLIVALTQYLLQYLVLLPALKTENFTPLLDHFHFFLLVLSTILIAAGGFIINDLKDYEIDILNKPDQVIINRKISSGLAKKLYWAITILGFSIALYLAFYVKNVPLVLIYPTAVLLLFLYSNSLKKSTLWGNLIVSVFCAFVPGVIIFAERENAMQFNQEEFKEGFNLFYFFLLYVIFAFLSTLFREIIKDIEDMEGDRKEGCKTLPIVAGIKTTKVITILVGLTLLVTLFLWKISNYPKYELLSNGFFYSGIIAPLIFSILFLIKAKTKSDYHKISQISKFIMLSGILYLLILTL